jgi:hypothetical protein
MGQVARINFYITTERNATNSISAALAPFSPVVPFVSTVLLFRAGSSVSTSGRQTVMKTQPTVSSSSK